MDGRFDSAFSSSAYSFYRMAVFRWDGLAFNSLLDTTPPSGYWSSGTDQCPLLQRVQKITAGDTGSGSTKYSLTWILAKLFSAYYRVRRKFIWRWTMLYWALMFLVVALIAGVLGFTGVAVAAAGISKILFFVFLVLFLVSLVANMGGRRSLN